MEAPKGFTLEQALADAEAGLKRCEEIAYCSLGYIPLPRGRVYNKQAPLFMGGPDDAKPQDKGKGNPSSTVLRPEGPKYNPKGPNGVKATVNIA